MDPIRFDRLAKSLSSPETRRRVFGVLAAVPVAGGLLGLLAPEETEAAGRRKRRKTRNKRRSGDDKKNRKGKRKRKKQPTCTPTTCAAQGKTCGSMADGCGKTVDCGPCTCATGCSDCQVCNPVTNQCDPIPNDTPCDDGDLCTINDVCTDGVCAGSPKCGGGQRCVGGACVCDATSCPTGCCDAQGQCQVGTEAGACGSIGGACIDCGTGGICEAGQCRCGTCSGPTPYCSRTNTCVTCQAFCSPCQCLTLSDGTQTCSSGQRFSCPQPGCTSNGECGGGGLECVNFPVCGPLPPGKQGFCMQVSRGNCPA